MTKLELPDNKFSIVADEVVSRVGRTASWIWVVLLSIIILNVTLRYLFSEGRIEFEEMQWHLNSIAFLIAIAYAHRHDVHIRIDLISVRLSHRAQAWIELYGTLLLLVPFLVMVLIFSFPFVEKSWKVSRSLSRLEVCPFDGRSRQPSPFLSFC